MDSTRISDPAADGTGQALPRYSVSDLNRSIGTLLERGFAPRFLLEATVARPQLKKGHLWMTLVDEAASISAVVWASQRPRLSFTPADGDGVIVVGKLNFWGARASLCVQALDIRPSLSSVLRQFERVREQLEGTGLFEPSRKQPLPDCPAVIALLTSSPSSALADMLRTAAERWPATKILVVPIPVQGAAVNTICAALNAVGQAAERLGIEAVVLARGGGNREDLAVFDSEELALTLAALPLPVVTGLGHEDDTTIADLVADYRAATPTAAIVALLPDQRTLRQELRQRQQQLHQILRWKLDREQQRLALLGQRLQQLQPHALLQRQLALLLQRRQLLDALSPKQLLKRGFCLVRAESGELLRSIQQVDVDQMLVVQWLDGAAAARVTERRHEPPAP
ncbi:exodeoxyribonuclease VII large subunit [Synechococcus sp. BSF8S]|uniref:exodeoxyribonuclease VII large subunit n=1 Tax=Synechococcales TaxID=1890424 RepID=UPI001C897B14|nr:MULTISPECIES: exodeoxyribonuclease VII large subunit [unclassified Synechococcus]MBC1261822.1 exodeoxyribonuclease VII large subunit [Synechococcus sp. BSF8S]MBC1264750.1 exodeoxyribonuclease VII large subunit [Synechococcus sp. BSA11S]